MIRWIRSMKVRFSLLKPLSPGPEQSTWLDTHHGAFVPDISIASNMPRLCSELILQCQRRGLSHMCRRALVCNFGTQQAHILGLRKSHQKQRIPSVPVPPSPAA